MARLMRVKRETLDVKRKRIGLPFSIQRFISYVSRFTFHFSRFTLYGGENARFKT